VSAEILQRFPLEENYFTLAQLTGEAEIEQNRIEYAAESFYLLLSAHSIRTNRGSNRDHYHLGCRPATLLGDVEGDSGA
jgi:protoheme ferro-lyase